MVRERWPPGNGMDRALGDAEDHAARLAKREAEEHEQRLVNEAATREHEQRRIAEARWKTFLRAGNAYWPDMPDDDAAIMSNVSTVLAFSEGDMQPVSDEDLKRAEDI